MRSTEAKPTNVLLFLIGLLSVNHEIVDSEIVQGPSNTTAKVNESIYFNCSTTIRPVDKNVIWFHFPLDGGGQRNYVYDDGRIMTNYKHRFVIEIDNSTGEFNLLVKKLEIEDAGRYECRDDVYADMGASADLTVLGSDLVCESEMDPGGVIGPTQCERAIAPDEVQMACSLTYSGKNVPEMAWRRSGDSLNSTSRHRSTDCVNRDSRVTCNTAITADLQLNRSVYICKLTTQQFSCSLRINNVLYAFANNSTKNGYYTGQDVTCKANASRQLACSYRWYKDNTAEVSSHPTFTPNDPGLYKCQAQCPMRADSCIFTAMMINVTDGIIDVSTSPVLELAASSLAPGFVALILCMMLIIATIVVIVCLIYIRRRKKRLSSNSPPIVNGDIPKHESERLLQPFEKKPEANDFSKLITLLPHLDKGSSGEVYGPCQFKGKTCAFQCILYSTSKLSAEKDKVEREIDDKGNRWLELEHENVIKLYSLHFEAPALYIFMEYADGGTVRKALDLCQEELPSDVIANWALQIASGMEYLHDKDIVHTHLKSAQILIMEPFDPSDVSKKKTLKIASYRISTDGIQSVPSFKGMFAWESPESIQRKTFSKPRDIWSYGVTVWEILTRSTPYLGRKHVAILENVMAGNTGLLIPVACPTFLHNIMMNCWAIEPDHRPSFSNIVSTLKDPKQNLISISSGNAIPEALVRLPYMDKGSSGEVFGPFLFQRNKCACERFMYSPTKVSSVSEDEICRQGRRWMELDHINILRFYHVLYVNPTLYVVMDYAEGESVRKALNSCEGDLEISVVKDWATQVAEGMNYLHERGIVHGRLNSAKVLIMEPFKEGDSSKKTLKIGPFGLATESHSVQVSFKGMFAWMAPESIKGSEHTCKASDVWSYGVTVWEILTRAIPFQRMKQAVIIKNIFEGNPTLPIPKQSPGAIRDILKECWSRDISKRPKFSDILSRLHASADS